LAANNKADAPHHRLEKVSSSCKIKIKLLYARDLAYYKPKCLHLKYLKHTLPILQACHCFVQYLVRLECTTPSPNRWEWQCQCLGDINKNKHTLIRIMQKIFLGVENERIWKVQTKVLKTKSQFDTSDNKLLKFRPGENLITLKYLNKTKPKVLSSWSITNYNLLGKSWFTPCVFVCVHWRLQVCVSFISLKCFILYSAICTTFTEHEAGCPSYFIKVSLTNHFHKGTK
jgi:hypothetical protein